jgi:hypothetical protein
MYNVPGNSFLLSLHEGFSPSNRSLQNTNPGPHNIKISATKYLGSFSPSECRWDLAEWLERLAANAKVATVLASIPAYTDTVESEGAEDGSSVEQSTYILSFSPSGIRISQFSWIRIHSNSYLCINRPAHKNFNKNFWLISPSGCGSIPASSDTVESEGRQIGSVEQSTVYT